MSLPLDVTLGFTSVRKKTEFLDKFSKTIDILPVFFWTVQVPIPNYVLCNCDGMRCFVCFVVINPRVLSANRVVLGFFVYINFPIFLWALFVLLFSTFFCFIIFPMLLSLGHRTPNAARNYPCPQPIKVSYSPAPWGGGVIRRYMMHILYALNQNETSECK